MTAVKVALVGVGNCANSLIQGIHYYADADVDDAIPGIMNVDLGGYHIGDVEIVAAFDVDATKVGQRLDKAMWAGENNTIKFADVPEIDVMVQRGPTLDGLGRYYRAFHAARKKDPTGYGTLQKVLGRTDMAEFQEEWEAWVLKLRYR